MFTKDEIAQLEKMSESLKNVVASEMKESEERLIKQITDIADALRRDIITAGFQSSSESKQSSGANDTSEKSDTPKQQKTLFATLQEGISG